MNILNIFLKSKIFDNLNIFLFRKLFKIFKFFFVETELTALPKTNYPLTVIDEDLENSKNLELKILNLIFLMSFTRFTRSD